MNELTHGRNCPALGDWDKDCTCGLQYRIQTQTAETLLAAWQKRATEAEAENQILLAVAKAADAVLIDIGIPPERPFFQSHKLRKALMDALEAAKSNPHIKAEIENLK